MNNINTYLKDYGQYTFLEEPFNDIDNVILSQIPYIELDDIVPRIKEGKITIQEASHLFFAKNQKTEISKDILAVRSASYLLEELANTKRYKDLYLCNYEYKTDFDTQFGALCILLPNKTMYVAFEGTDGNLSGWKEDCMFACSFPTTAQKEAILYLDQVIKFFGPKIYVGGHSKGGNLALVSAMYCKAIHQHKIIQVFNNDGPGLRKKEFESKEYQKIKPKLKMIVPKTSMIGMLLRHDEPTMVVASSNSGIMQHDAFSWSIEKNHFIESTLSDFSKKIESSVLSWLSQLNDHQRKKFVDSLFGILKKADINHFKELKQAKLNSTIRILKETKNLDKETRHMLMSCLTGLIKEIRK